MAYLKKNNLPPRFARPLRLARDFGASSTNKVSRVSESGKMKYRMLLPRTLSVS